MKKPKTIGHLCLGALAGSAVGLALLTSTQAGSFNADFNDNQVPLATAVYGDQGDGNAGVIQDGILKLTKPVPNQNGVPFDTRRLIVSVGYLNGVLITNLIDGKCAYAASDPRAGNQIQMLFSPDFDLSGKTDVFVAYHSIYTQNQDSLGAVEYSIDQGKSWLPIIYMLDDSGASGGFDIVRMTNAVGEVSIDGAATLTKPV